MLIPCSGVDYFHHLLHRMIEDHGGGGNVAQLRLRLDGPLDERALARAWRAMGADAWVAGAQWRATLRGPAWSVRGPAELALGHASSLDAAAAAGLARGLGAGSRLSLTLWRRRQQRAGDVGPPPMRCPRRARPARAPARARARRAPARRLVAPAVPPARRAAAERARAQCAGAPDRRAPAPAPRRAPVASAAAQRQPRAAAGRGALPKPPPPRPCAWMRARLRRQRPLQRDAIPARLPVRRRSPSSRPGMATCSFRWRSTRCTRLRAPLAEQLPLLHLPAPATAAWRRPTCPRRHGTSRSRSGGGWRARCRSRWPRRCSSSPGWASAWRGSSSATSRAASPPRAWWVTPASPACPIPGSARASPRSAMPPRSRARPASRRCSTASPAASPATSSPSAPPRACSRPPDWSRACATTCCCATSPGSSR